MRNINYNNPTDIRFGWGRVSEVGEIVAGYGKRCLMVTVKPFSALEPVFERIKKLCADAGVEILHFDGVQPNPTTDNVNAGVEVAKKNNVDVILGVGGGSSMDVAKCISVVVTHEGDAWEYRVIDGKAIEDKINEYLVKVDSVETKEELLKLGKEIKIAHGKELRKFAFFNAVIVSDSYDQIIEKIDNA